MNIISGSIFQDICKVYDFSQIRVCITDEGEVYTRSTFRKHFIITWFLGNGLMHVYDMRNELVCPEKEKEMENEYKVFDTHWVLSDTRMGFEDFMERYIQ